MTTCPRLIEVALPIREISAESVRDKSLRHGHISTLHLWWARRTLAVRVVVVPAARSEACPERSRRGGAATPAQEPPIRPGTDIDATTENAEGMKPGIRPVPSVNSVRSVVQYRVWGSGRVLTPAQSDLSSSLMADGNPPNLLYYGDNPA